MYLIGITYLIKNSSRRLNTRDGIFSSMPNYNVLFIYNAVLIANV